MPLWKAGFAAAHRWSEASQTDVTKVPSPHPRRPAGQAATWTYVRTYVTVCNVNATKLRADLYTVLDQVLASGNPVVIERKGRRLLLSVDESDRAKPPKKPAWPKARPEWVNGNVEDLVDIDWSKEWRP